MSADAIGIITGIALVMYIAVTHITTVIRREGSANRAKLDSIYQRLHGIDERGHRSEIKKPSGV
jgi:hypothetical protein